MKRSFLIISLIAAIAILGFIFTQGGEAEVAANKENATRKAAGEKENAAEKESSETTTMKYGLPIERFIVLNDTIGRNETLANAMYRLGFSSSEIYTLTQCPDSIFNVKKIQAGQACALLCDKDSTKRHFVFETSKKSFVIFDISDGYKATRHEKPTEWREKEIAGQVNTSLWNAMEERGTSPLIAVSMSHVFGWSVDFFGIQKEDEFRVIYAQEFVEEEPLDNYRIVAASFRSSGNTFYAIPYTQDSEELYYNIDGNSLEGAFLKAPLDYYRISSKFSNSRYHPVLKRHRAHHGVDYAAPKGTPVYAIGSGKVIKKAYQANGAGYYIKIRHNSTYTTSYMHLSKFAKGLKEGDFVKQKQVIGYVGSTGLSTGPHLDFRVFENGKPINPLTIKSQPKKPISEANKEGFNAVKDIFVKRLTAIPIGNIDDKATESAGQL